MKRKTKASTENMTPHINWDNIHTRLDEIREKLAKEWTVTEQEKERILLSRTRALASRPEAGPLTGEILEVAGFTLAEERYGIEQQFLKEVYQLKDLTPLPCTPPFILGVINVRGKIITVMDMRKLFDLPEKGLTEQNKVIIAHASGMEAGILADAVSGSRSVPLENLQPALPTHQGIRAEYMKGVTGDQMTILNIEAIFSDEKIIVNEVI